MSAADADRESLDDDVVGAAEEFGKPLSSDEQHHEGLLAQVITVRCADCLWEHTAPQRDARVAWGEHRRDDHHDQAALAGVLASLERGPTRRRAGIPVDHQRIAENLRKTRAAGGGHGRAPTNGRVDVKPKWTREAAAAAVRRFVDEVGSLPKGGDLCKANDRGRCRITGCDCQVFQESRPRLVQPDASWMQSATTVRRRVHIGPGHPSKDSR